MEREEKLEAIYAKVANKELALWCKARIYHTNHPNLADKYFWEITKYIEVVSMGNSHFENWQIVKYKDLQHSFLKEDCYGFEVFDPIILQNYRDCFFKVIWHPVMIGDVMDYLEDKSRSQFDEEEEEEYFYSREEYYEDIAELSDCWGDKRLCIDEQSEECIDLVYSLIEKL